MLGLVLGNTLGDALGLCVGASTEQDPPRASLSAAVQSTLALAHVLVPAQSASAQHLLPVGQGGHEPPQSTSDSAAPLMPSLHVASEGDADGDHEGDRDGTLDGKPLGEELGEAEGLALGLADGAEPGDWLGLALGDRDGLVEGLEVGASVEHWPPRLAVVAGVHSAWAAGAVHVLVPAQPASSQHFLPVMQGGHEPPQSTSASVVPLTSSLHVASVGDADGDHEGDTVGLLDGEPLGDTLGEVDGDPVGDSVLPQHDMNAPVAVGQHGPEKSSKSTHAGC